MFLQTPADGGGSEVFVRFSGGAVVFSSSFNSKVATRYTRVNILIELALYVGPSFGLQINFTTILIFHVSLVSSAHLGLK